MTAVAPAASLRPRGLGELLDQAIRLYRANFLKFIGIIALVEIPVGLLEIITTTIMLKGATDFSSLTRSNPESVPSLSGLAPFLGGAGATMVVGILSFFLVQGIGTAALTRAIADGYMGEPVSILGSYRKIGSHWLSLIKAMLLMILINLGALIWTAVPCVGWLTGFGLLAFMSFVVTPLLGPIIVLEKAPAMTAIRRAWDLGRARFWWLVGYVGILFLFNLIVISGPSALLQNLLVSPIQKQSLLAGGASQTYLLATVLQQGLTILLSILYFSLQAIAITLAYFDLRMRLEGFDLAVQALSPNQSIVEQMSQAPTLQTNPKIFSSDDILRFLLLTLVFVGVYAILIGIGMAIGLGVAGLSGGP